VDARRVLDGVAVREWGGAAEPGTRLWAGLGATSGYFAPVAAALPGRTVAVDPPGSGRSAPLDPCTYGALVGLAESLIERFRCQSMVGHSLGAYLAAGVACSPPAGLRAVVLIDGGFLSAEGMAELGIPVTAERPVLVDWLNQTAPSFPDWETAVSELAAMFGAPVTPALEAYVREAMAEVDGAIRAPAPPDRVAELLQAILGAGVPARASQIAVPTLLLACAQPAERRASRERAWRAFADASPLIELAVGEDWGHNPVLADPAACGALIGEWLRAHL
jgi:pimeloyl-ACP methyl ester carboxylesterase